MAQKEKVATYVCPECKRGLNDFAVSCTNCGTDLMKVDPRPPEVLAKSINKNEQSVFFYVSPVKLVVMSIFSFGFYDIFWHYKNWNYVNEHTNSKRYPLILAIFAGFSYFMLLAEIRRAGAQMGREWKVPTPLIGLAYFVLLVSYRLPGMLYYVGFLAPLALLPAQNFINSLNAESKTPINSRFSIANWVLIVIGAIFHFLVFLGFLLPDTPSTPLK